MPFEKKKSASIALGYRVYYKLATALYKADLLATGWYYGYCNSSTGTHEHTSPKSRAWSIVVRSDFFPKVSSLQWVSYQIIVIILCRWLDQKVGRLSALFIITFKNTTRKNGMRRLDKEKLHCCQTRTIQTTQSGYAVTAGFHSFMVVFTFVQGDQRLTVCLAYCWGMCSDALNDRAADSAAPHAPSVLTLSLLRVINVKFPLQPHQKYNITQYEELGFS